MGLAYRTQQERLQAVEDLIPLYESHANTSQYAKVYRNIAEDLKRAVCRFANPDQIKPEDCPHEETQLRRKEIGKKYANPAYKHVEVCLLCGDEVREW